MPHKGYEFLKALKRGELASHLYVLAGREELMMESALKILEEKLAPCDRKVYYIDEMTVQELLQSSSTGDLFGSSRKITVIKGIEKPGKSRKNSCWSFSRAYPAVFSMSITPWSSTSGPPE